MHKIIFHLIVFLIINTFSSTAKENGPRIPDVAIESALLHNINLKYDIDIVKKSINTYIPFNNGNNGIIFNTNINHIKNYDILCLIIDFKENICNIIVVDKLKIFVYKKTKKQCKNQLSIHLTEETKTNLMLFMKKYKESNKINKKISEKNIINIYNSFGTYACDQQDIFIVYGLKSNIFGVVFGGILIPENTPSSNTYSLFDSILAYADNINNGYIKRDDLLFNKVMNKRIRLEN